MSECVSISKAHIVFIKLIACIKTLLTAHIGVYDKFRQFCAMDRQVEMQVGLKKVDTVTIATHTERYQRRMLD